MTLKSFFKPSQGKGAWTLGLFFGHFLATMLTVFCAMGLGRCTALVVLTIVLEAPIYLINWLLPWGGVAFLFQYIALILYDYAIACVIIEAYRAFKGRTRPPAP